MDEIKTNGIKKLTGCPKCGSKNYSLGLCRDCGYFPFEISANTPFNHALEPINLTLASNAKGVIDLGGITSLSESASKIIDITNVTGFKPAQLENLVVAKRDADSELTKLEAKLSESRAELSESKEQLIKLAKDVKRLQRSASATQVSTRRDYEKWEKETLAVLKSHKCEEEMLDSIREVGRCLFSAPFRASIAMISVAMEDALIQRLKIAGYDIKAEEAKGQEFYLPHLNQIAYSGYSLISQRTYGRINILNKIRRFGTHSKTGVSLKADATFSFELFKEALKELFPKK